MAFLVISSVGGVDRVCDSGGEASTSLVACVRTCVRVCECVCVCVCVCTEMAEVICLNSSVCCSVVHEREHRLCFGKIVLACCHLFTIRVLAL